MQTPGSPFGNVNERHPAVEVCVMKYIIKRFLTVLLILLAPILSLAQTTTTFDKFKNTTHFMTKETPASKVTVDGGKDASILIHQMGMVIGFSCEGQVDICKP